MRAEGGAGGGQRSGEVDPEGPGAAGPGVPVEALSWGRHCQRVPKPLAWEMMVRMRRGWRGARRGVRRGPGPPERTLKAVPGQACSRSLRYLGLDRTPAVCPVIRACHARLTVLG